MSTMAAAAHPSHRARVLRALGVTPWVLRSSPQVEAPLSSLQGSSEQAMPGDCVVLLPAGSDPRALDLVGRALHACGAVVARAARLEVRDGHLPGVPQARAYLAFGEAQAHALGRELPATVLHQAHIVLADEPGQVLASAAAKRRLWSALRALRRALAGQGG